MVIKKLTAIILAFTLIAVPSLKTAHAAEINDITCQLDSSFLEETKTQESQSEDISSSGDIIDTITVQGETIKVKPLSEFNFTSFDDEDKNIGYIKSENSQSKINIKTGDITHTFYDENGNKYEYETNYYENLKGLDDSEDELVSPSKARSVIVGGSAGKLSYNVNRTTRDYITIKNSKWTSFFYSKKKGNYYSGNTKKFIDIVIDAKTPYNNLKSSFLIATVSAAIIAYIGLPALAVSATTIKDAVIACGFSIGTVSGAWTYITSNYNKYRELARKADNYYYTIKG